MPYWKKAGKSTQEGGGDTVVDMNVSSSRRVKETSWKKTAKSNHGIGKHLASSDSMPFQ